MSSEEKLMALRATQESLRHFINNPPVDATDEEVQEAQNDLAHVNQQIGAIEKKA
jgi:hypothetical protein